MGILLYKTKDRASYIAMKKVKITKESSCEIILLTESKSFFIGMLESVKELMRGFFSKRKENLSEIVILNDK